MNLPNLARRYLRRRYNQQAIDRARKAGETTVRIDLDGTPLDVPLPASPGLEKSLVKGSYEGDERIMVARLLSPEDRVLELGAAVGALACKYGKLSSGPHVAVEANGALIPLLKDNLTRNDVTNVTIMHGLADTQEGEAIFHAHPDFYSSSVLKSEGEAQTVRRYDVNRLIRDYGVNVILSDIEGAEYGLLSGVDLTPVDKLMIEVHDSDDTAADLTAMLSRFNSNGFAFDVRKWRGNVLVFSRERHG